jgi:DNA-binding CsgD family transcriptional regulator
MICTAATFTAESDAEHTRRELAKRKFPPVQVYLCEKCDHFHFRGTSPDLRIWKTMGKVLRLCAMGFTADTIVEMTGYTRFTVYDALRQIRQEFGALNLPHVVAIAIALGYLEPNEFIPPVADKEHCERT